MKVFGPRTKQAFRKYHYGPDAKGADPKRCAAHVPPRGLFMSHQCNRPSGCGPHKMFCLQHAKLIEREDEK